MTSIGIRHEFDRILNDLAEELDVPPSKYEQAKARYGAVGNWLEAPDSPLNLYKPVIYPQGSFALGTVIRPIGDEDYDVDVVCHLERTPPNISQHLLKAIVGDRLKQHGKYSQMLDPKDGGRRCWTLQYAEEAKFHLDILPAIPDDPSSLIRIGVPTDLARHAILITDSTTWDTDLEWPKSNPMGYVLWFKSRTRVRLDEGRRLLAMERQARIEDIQDYEVRTPLQRVIQILKRHRDVQYADDEDKPISIIITTLAASAYQDEASISETLLSIVPKMRAELENKKRGLAWWVPNPVSPDENFADKWELEPRKAQLFFEWLDLIEREHRELLTETGFQKIGEYLTEAYGAREASKALEKFSRRSRAGRLVPYGSPSALAESIQELTTFNLPQRRQPIWPIVLRLASSVAVTAKCRKTGNWRSLSNNGQVVRGSSLQFTAISSIQQPFEVFWQVVNTGRDARLKQQLRGQFEPPRPDATNPLVRDESADYRGRHWIECFIVQNGVCVARSGEFVVNIV